MASKSYSMPVISVVEFQALGIQNWIGVCQKAILINDEPPKIEQIKKINALFHKRLIFENKNSKNIYLMAKLTWLLFENVSLAKCKFLMTYPDNPVSDLELLLTT